MKLLKQIPFRKIWNWLFNAGKWLGKKIATLVSTILSVLWAIAKFFNKWFDIILSCLARVSGLIYILLYFSLIPIFAIIYSPINDEFYHSTIKSEPYFQETLIDFKGTLESDIFTFLKKQNNGQETVFLDDNTYVNIRELEIKERLIEVSGKNIDITLFIPIHHVKNGSIGIEYSTIKIFGGTSECPAFAGKKLKRTKLIEERINGTFQRLGLIISPPCDAFVKDALVISPKSERYFGYLTQASRGTPIELDGNYARMLYLSATTLTTLGGDITPITNRARRYVMYECFLGVFIIGLFFNSLTTTGNNHSNKTQETQKQKTNTNPKKRSSRRSRGRK